MTEQPRWRTVRRADLPDDARGHRLCILDWQMQFTCFCWSFFRSPHLYFSSLAVSRRCPPPRASSPGGLYFALVPPGICLNWYFTVKLSLWENVNMKSSVCEQEWVISLIKDQIYDEPCLLFRLSVCWGTRSDDLTLCYRPPPRSLPWAQLWSPLNSLESWLARFPASSHSLHCIVSHGREKFAVETSTSLPRLCVLMGKKQRQTQWWTWQTLVLSNKTSQNLKACLCRTRM